MADLTLRMGAGGDPVGGSFWAEVGGRPTFEKLVRAFYDGVRTDESWPDFAHIDIQFTFTDITEEQAGAYVEVWKANCPLYRAVVKGTPCTVTFEAK